MPKHKKILLAAGIVLLLSVGLLFYFLYKEFTKHEFKVIFFDVGQGDASLIQFANGEQMLVDCGPDKNILSRLGRALPFYDRSIDYLMVTHPDLDHYGGCIDVLKNYTIKRVIVNGHTKSDSFWQTWEKTLQAEGAMVKVISDPQVWTIASSTLEFLSPDKDLALKIDADDSNNYSIIFRLKNDDASFLFTADMELPLENALLEKYCIDISVFNCPALEANILKVGHHGSDTSSGEDFLRAVKAKEGVVSNGKNNKYGHPSLRVLRKLERAGMGVIRTDTVGNIAY